MFTGIIEAIGIVSEIIPYGANKTFWIKSSLSNSLSVDQSICHDGVCLTVEEVSGDCHRVTAISETLQKTNLDLLCTGSSVNLERSMLLNGRIDGHIVQGHVDCTVTCAAIEQKHGSWEFRFLFPPKFSGLVIEKGSVCINGISLTCFNLGKDHFTVAIIPYTYDHTNISQVKEGSQVNIEWDILGKYISRKMEFMEGIGLTQL